MRDRLTRPAAGGGNAALSRSSVESRVRTVLARTLGCPEGELPPDARIKQTAAWDSLTHVQLMVALEDEFGVEIDGETILHLTTLGRIVDHFEGLPPGEAIPSGKAPAARDGGRAPDPVRFMASLGETLPRLGVEHGDLLLVHSFIGGLLAGGGDARALCGKLVERLRDAVGPRGTLVMPTFTNVFARGGRLDRARTPSDMGILTEHFRTLPGVRHTRHPVHRFSALGPHAEDLAACDCPSAFGPGSPLHVMHRLGGKVLLFSADWESCTFFHYVEEQFEVPYRYYKDLTGTAMGPEGPRRETWQEFAGNLGHGCEDPFNAFGRRLEGAGLCEPAWVGPVRLKVFRMDKVFEFTYAALEENVRCLIEP